MDNKQPKPAVAETKTEDDTFEYFGVLVLCHKDFPSDSSCVPQCMTTQQFFTTLDDAVTNVRFAGLSKILQYIFTDEERKEFEAHSQAPISIDTHLKAAKTLWYSRPAAERATHMLCCEWYFRRSTATKMVQVVRPTEERLAAVKVT